MRGCYYGKEDDGGRKPRGDLGDGEEAVFEDRVEDAELLQSD